jgi:hypothetical protein
VTTRLAQRATAARQRPPPHHSTPSATAAEPSQTQAASSQPCAPKSRPLHRRTPTPGVVWHMWRHDAPRTHPHTFMSAMTLTLTPRPLHTSHHPLSAPPTPSPCRAVIASVVCRPQLAPRRAARRAIQQQWGTASTCTSTPTPLQSERLAPRHVRRSSHSPTSTWRRNNAAAHKQQQAWTSEAAGHAPWRRSSREDRTASRDH